MILVIHMINMKQFHTNQINHKNHSSKMDVHLFYTNGLDES